jgi:hypothetical protein
VKRKFLFKIMVEFYIYTKNDMLQGYAAAAEIFGASLYQEIHCMLPEVT